LDQGKVIAARTAASSFATPLANEATGPARALDPWDKAGLGLSPDHQVEFGDDLACLDQGWYASFESFWLTESSEGFVRRPFQLVVCGSPTR
jgi:hypothetical protein